MGSASQHTQTSLTNARKNSIGEACSLEKILIIKAKKLKSLKDLIKTL
jgi:hypothetical protein